MGDGETVETVKKEYAGKRRRNGAGPGAYMTVEASLILPLVFCMFVILMYTAIYLYDRCLFTQDAYISCLRESRRKEEGEPSVDPAKIEAEMQKLTESGYFAVRSWTGTAGTEKEIVTETGTFRGVARVTPAVFGGSILMPDNIWDMTFSASAGKNDPAWMIRSFRRKTFLLRKTMQFSADGEG